MTTRLSLLTNLQEYYEATDAGHEALKSSLWQITKLRRKQNRGMLTMEDTFHADQIREELRARTVVRDLKEPALIVEGEKPSSLDSGAPEWELVNVLDVRAANKENNSTTATSTTSSGLRQRNNKGGSTGDAKKADDQTSSPKMTEELQVDEEEMLIQRDTLNLFAGVRPTDLKSAQKHAKVALASYIEAANRAAQILTQLGEAKGTK